MRGRHDCTYCHAIQSRYATGMGVSEIADALGRGYYQVRQMLVHHGIRPERRGRRTHQCGERCEAIRTAYLGGDSLETVGLRHRLSSERIRQILRQHKIPVRASGGARTAVHVCDEICRELLAQEPPIFITRVAEAHGWPQFSVRWRATVHRLRTATHAEALKYRPHVCVDRCRALISYLDTHPDATTYTAASATGVPSSWTSGQFRLKHPDHWRVRPFRVVAGRRVRGTTGGGADGAPASARTE